MTRSAASAMSPSTSGAAPLPLASSGAGGTQYRAAQSSSSARLQRLPALQTGVGAGNLTIPPPPPTPGLGPGAPGFSPYSPATPIIRNDRSSSNRAFSSIQAAATPITPAMERYDPRQWTNRTIHGGASASLHQPTVSDYNGRPMSMGLSGNEAVFVAPPPSYQEAANTPSPSSRPAQWDNAALAPSPLAHEVSTQASPQSAMSTAFPPPPSQSSSRFRDRSGSGFANQLLNLSGLRNKQPSHLNPPQSPAITGPSVMDLRPPASRRAASTGHIHDGAASVRSAIPPSQRTPEPSYESSASLPGPPPGPPPTSQRSQSLNRIPSGPSSRPMAINVRQDGRSSHLATQVPLGPIPPTPADWIDSDHPPASARLIPTLHADEPNPQDQHYQPLRIDTGTGDEVVEPQRLHRREGSIRERRSQSRAARDPNAKDSNYDTASGSGTGSGSSNTTQQGRLISAPTDGAISRRRDHHRTASGVPGATSIEISTNAGNSRSSSQPAIRNMVNVMTPPLTAKSNHAAEESLKRRSAVRKAPNSATSDRPLSQLLSARSADEDGAPLSVSPSQQTGRPPSSGSVRNSTKLDPFYLLALERHRAFIDKEASAASDAERLELFASFLVHESRIRRDHYAVAYTGMASDIMDLTRDMWRSYTRQGKRAATPSTSVSSADPPVPAWASDGPHTSAHENMPSSASSFGDFPAMAESPSLGESKDGVGRSISRQWAEEFKPSLSPIPSMAVSTTNDGDSSRGRKSSRWWEENSGSGNGSVGKPGRIERSHRETKYMGVMATTLQEIDPASQMSPDYNKFTPTPGASMQNFTYGPNDYPPEKVGWHEPFNNETPLATPGLNRERKTSNCSDNLLDVSRLVTLPPPYPRHHPAVNNSHPVLAELRNQQRSLADLTDIRDIYTAYEQGSETMQREQQEQAQERRRQLRANIQQQISSNTISFAEAAQAEAEFDQEEAQREKAKVRDDFDLFEDTVARPLNDVIAQRLLRAGECIDQLRVELSSRNDSSDPNQAQEEGDDQPERLEQLTLLKWLFESREQLHKEMYDLHAERSTKYSEVVLTPFRIDKLEKKIKEATAFFARDARERQTTFAKDSARRFEQLQNIVESNVTQGVEAQLSAFWDIAPALVEVIQHIPPREELRTVEISIPAQEHDENPSYSSHPTQYLYTVLAHAEKSTYQFIESQINLLCLLHEVRTASAQATLRLLEIEQSDSSASGKQDAKKGTDADSVLREEMRFAIREREESLTADLKDKVGVVERQWREAVGDALERCKSNVRDWLVESGGWEDGLE